MKNTLLSLLALPLLFAACQGTRQEDTHIQASGATQSVPVNQVEDAAIWIHPTDPAKSLLFVANKTHGMEIHNPAGTLLKHYEDGRPLAGVDVLYNFPLNGATIDLLIAASPADQNPGVRLWKIETAKSRLTEITRNPLPVLNGDDPLGIVACHAAGQPTLFVTSAAADIEQYILHPQPDGTISATKARTIPIPGKIKAGIADEQNGLVYFASEKNGIYALSTNPASTTPPALILPINDHGMTADLTGITLFATHDNRGYLIVVSQKPKGDPSSLFLFDRTPPHRFVTQLLIDDSPFGGVYSSSGIAVTNVPIAPNFPAGMLALKNRFNPNASEDYKLFSWSTLAKNAHLLTDPTYSPRAP